MADKETREEKIEKLKKSHSEKKSNRPMGYIYPNRIQQIMRGETPVIKVGWAPALDKDYEKPPERKIGEKWMDSDDNEWEQKDGYKMRLPKYLDEINKVDTCPKCGNTIKTDLDKKFFLLRKSCFDCQIKFETKLRVSGGWEEYERETMLSNYTSFLKESKEEIEDFLLNLSDKQEFVTEDGKIEKWQGDVSKVREFFIGELKNIDESLEKLEKEKENGQNGRTEVEEGN